MNSAIQSLLDGKPVGRQQSRAIFSAVMRGELQDAQIAAVLMAFKHRGETPEQIAGAADALLADVRVFPRPAGLFGDIVGTGGDGAGTINISTAATFVAAQCGLPMVKHGNRSVSSRCGAADVLEMLGVQLQMSPQVARQALDVAGATFLFAPHYHRGFQHVMPVRKLLATRTIFNLLGPLLNPARAPVMLVGVYDPSLCEPMAQTLGLLGCQRALVVNGLGLDEIALHGATQAAELRDGHVQLREFSPADFGVRTFPLQSLGGGDVGSNADALRAVLSGRGNEAHSAAVAVNAGALLSLSGHARDFADGYALARDAMAHGGALARLEQLAACSQWAHPATEVA